MTQTELARESERQEQGARAHATGKKNAFGGANRPSGGNLSRFLGTSSHGQQAAAALPYNHPAIAEGRTMFRTRVRVSKSVPRILVGGVNSAKIGRRITKGDWAGMPVFTLTLEERRTCPETCLLWRECYGNAMPLARRVVVDRDFWELLTRELQLYQIKYPRGFAVRVHVLGDFVNAGYLSRWLGAMRTFPALHAWGYTAHARGSALGRCIARAADLFPGRWMFRFSEALGASAEPMQVTTIWKHDPGSEVDPPRPVTDIICPAQTHQTQACSTCGLCWSENATGKRIVFIGHGMNNR